MKFSIIIPVYMSEKYIEECISSILSQDYTDFELLIMDDGSTDNSIPICRRLIADDSRARICSLPHAGVSRARNAGILKASGDYILFADSDDTLQKDCLSRLSREIDDKDIYMFGYTFYKANGETEAILPKLTEKIPSELALCYYSSGYTNSVWNKLFKRSFLLENALTFDEHISMGEDLLFNYSCAAKTDAVYPLPYALYNYIQHPNSLSLKPTVNTDVYDALKKTRGLLDSGSRAADEFELYITETYINNLTKLCVNTEAHKASDLKALKKELTPRLTKYLVSPLPPLASKLHAAVISVSPGLWRALFRIHNLFKKR